MLPPPPPPPPFWFKPVMLTSVTLCLPLLQGASRHWRTGARGARPRRPVAPPVAQRVALRRLRRHRARVPHIAGEQRPTSVSAGQHRVGADHQQGLYELTPPPPPPPLPLQGPPPPPPRPPPLTSPNPNLPSLVRKSSGSYANRQRMLSKTASPYGYVPIIRRVASTSFIKMLLGLTMPLDSSGVLGVVCGLAPLISVRIFSRYDSLQCEFCLRLRREYNATIDFEWRTAAKRTTSLPECKYRSHGTSAESTKKRLEPD